MPVSSLVIPTCWLVRSSGSAHGRKSILSMPFAPSYEADFSAHVLDMWPMGGCLMHVSMQFNSKSDRDAVHGLS